MKWGLGLAALAACEGGDRRPRPVDAGDAGADATPDEPAPPQDPAPPALPDLTPCPDGWREISDPSEPRVATCDPWPEGGRKTCAQDESHFPGDPGCTLVGTPCPGGDFADDLPAAGVWYVLAGAPGGGDGSRTAPFATIAGALDVAAAGDVVALSRGVFDEVVVLRGVTLWGACVAGTTVAASVPATDATITLHGGAAVRNLTVSGARPGIDVFDTDREATVEAVVVRDVDVVGVRVSRGGVLVARDLVVGGTRGGAAGSLGLGVEGQLGGRMDLDRVVLESNRAQALRVGDEGTSATVARAAIVDTRARGDGEAGFGVAVVAGTLELVRSVVEGTQGVGLFVGSLGSIDATDLVVRDGESRPIGSDYGYGIEVWNEGEATLRRAWLSRNRTAGVLVDLAAARLQAQDVVVTDSRPREGDGQYGNGILVALGASARIDRALLARNRSVGLAVEDPATDVFAGDLTVVDTRPDPLGFGYGAYVGSGGSLAVERASVERSTRIGVHADGTGLDGTEVSLTDVAIEATGAQPSDLGYGLLVEHAAADLLRVRVEGSRTAAIAVLSGTLVGADIVGADTGSRESDGDYGYGLVVGLVDGTTASSASIDRAAFLRSRRAGVVVVGQGTQGSLRDLVVEDTMERECASTTCLGSGGGAGIASVDSARLDATRFRSSRGALCGVMVARDAGMDLSDGVVSHNPVGANVQVDDYDLARLQDGVLYVDNQRALDSAALPVPAPVE